MLSKKQLHHKRARKETKRNLKRKAIRKYNNQLLGLGIRKRNVAFQRARRTASINEALVGVGAIIKRWCDKISEELITKVEAQKIILKTAMKSKDDAAIKKAVDDFVPLNDELLAIVKKYDSPEKETSIA